jgi:glucose-6-phosphate isomerase
MEEQIHKHVNDRPDSITIGTPSKGGELKVYFNARSDSGETTELINRAFAARRYAQEKYATQPGNQ